MTFCEHLRAKFGDKWVLGARLTASMKAKGYTTLITPKMYDTEELTWAAANPAEVLAQLSKRDREMLTAAGLLKVAA